MLCACAHGPDIKERIAPAIQAYYKFHDTRLVHFGLLHKKPTEAPLLDCFKHNLAADYRQPLRTVCRRSSAHLHMPIRNITTSSVIYLLAVITTILRCLMEPLFQIAPRPDYHEQFDRHRR